MVRYGNKITMLLVALLLGGLPLVGSDGPPGPKPAALVARAAAAPQGRLARLLENVRSVVREKLGERAASLISWKGLALAALVAGGVVGARRLKARREIALWSALQECALQSQVYHNPCKLSAEERRATLEARRAGTLPKGYILAERQITGRGYVDGFVSVETDGTSPFCVMRPWREGDDIDLAIWPVRRAHGLAESQQLALERAQTAAEHKRLKDAYDRSPAGQLHQRRADPELLRQLKNPAEVRDALRFIIADGMRECGGLSRNGGHVRYSVKSGFGDNRMKVKQIHSLVTEKIPEFDNAFFVSLFQLCNDVIKYDPEAVMEDSDLARRLHDYATTPFPPCIRGVPDLGQVDLRMLPLYLENLTEDDMREVALACAAAELWAITTFDGQNGEGFFGDVEKAKQAVNDYIRRGPLFRELRVRCDNDAQYDEILEHLKQATIR